MTESASVAKNISKKHCKKCGVLLTPSNTYSSIVKRYRYICKDCFRTMMKKLADRKFPWEVKRDVYIIEKKREDGSIPRILIKKTGAGSEALFDMLDDTESYRVNKMVNLLPSVSEGKEIRQIVVYLLKSWDALTTEQCAVVLNAANNLIGSSEFDADIKAKMALDLRAFIIASNKNKKQNELVSTFEQLRDVDGKIEVEIPV